MNIDKSLTYYFPFLNQEKETERWKGKIPSSKILRELKPETLTGEKKKLYEVAEEFHSLFVKMMLNSMRKTLNKENDLLYGGFQQEIYEDMLYDEYAKVLSKNMNSPLVKEIYFQLEKFINDEGKSDKKDFYRLQNQIEKNMLSDDVQSYKEWIR